jgi:hypothetical protein
MKRILSALLTLGVLAALLVLTTVSKHAVPVAHAQGGCGVGTLTGTYAVSAPGFIFPGNGIKGAEVPLAAVGTFTFDGAGNWSAAYTLAINGEIIPGVIASGTYTVDSDCTGTMTFVAGGHTPNFNMVIIGGGTEIFGIETTPGFTGTVDAKKQ